MKSNNARQNGACSVKTACTLDCWDTCAIIARVRDNKVLSVSGNPENQITGRTLCVKGNRHTDILYHPDRLKNPLIRVNDNWQPLCWDDALDHTAEKMAALREKHPTTALMHCYDAGNGGVLKGIDRRFFNAYGGVTGPRGSLCWGAGIKAQKYDFGDVLSHHPSDMENSKTVLIWSRNPWDTNIHLVPFIQKAAQNGATVIAIDPLKTATAAKAHHHFAPLPGTDGALALTMANVLLSHGLLDREFIGRHVLGFAGFEEYIRGFTPDKGSEITGIPAEDIIFLARSYGLQKPSCIILGYGLQRYSNGGNTIRAIDALAAITGNIGIPGGGVNYANRRIPDFIDGSLLEGTQLKADHREYPRPGMAAFIEEAKSPPVKMLFTARANPVTQAMDSNRLARAISKVEFKVTVDLFMTDTAAVSDLVLPCRHFLEDEDIIYTSMGHSYINYCNKAVEPDPWVPSELWIFNELANRLNLRGFPVKGHKWWLERAILPLTKQKGITLDDLKAGPVQLPGVSPVAWDDFVFKTPSGRIELYSERAKEDGQSPLPVYKDINPKPSGKYPYRLLTPHTRSSLHSQHFVLVEDGVLPVAYINPVTAAAENIGDGTQVLVSTGVGQLKCRARIDESIRRGIVMVYEGWWIQKSGGVNTLTPERETDMGCQAAYYDCLCNIRPSDR